ncbi:hypothetical protein IHE44_0010821 [Lamprotornis superbus]|uniref:Peptidyl-prolyl cis-trans isomerase FKBP11 n=1 Tax=Lamprotornis superbus TaxID=245042 RepID=A0A835NEN5_9PASS|nr:hypothetical protein IHE44_0010821 [Lamprotornis superbus]
MEKGSLEDGRIIDSSLSRDPLQVELGKHQVIPAPLTLIPQHYRSGAESAGHVCGVSEGEGHGRGRCPRVVSPPRFVAPTLSLWQGEAQSHHSPSLSLWQAGISPHHPRVPVGSLWGPCSGCALLAGDTVLRFEVELVGLSRASYWQKVVNDVVPLLCLGLVPALLGLIGFHLYHKASSPKLSKKKQKEEKRNKAKKK